MSHSVKVRFQTNLPGAGYDINGLPVNGKRIVVGQLWIGNYVTAGEAIAPQDLDLSTIDYIDFETESWSATTGTAWAPTGQNYQTKDTQMASYFNRSAGKVVVITDTDSGVAGTVTELSGTGEAYLRFIAVGDTAVNSDLT